MDRQSDSSQSLCDVRRRRTEGFSLVLWEVSVHLAKFLDSTDLNPSLEGYCHSIEKFNEFYGKLNFITVLRKYTTAPNPEPDESIEISPNILRSVFKLIFLPNVHLCLPSATFPDRFPNKL